MPNPLLVPLLRERQFYAALLVGLPLLVFGYAEVWGALVHGHELDVTATIASLTANPVVIYLGLRQIPRAATVLAIGQERAARPIVDGHDDDLEVHRLRDVPGLLDDAESAELEARDAALEARATDQGDR